MISFTVRKPDKKQCHWNISMIIHHICLLCMLYNTPKPSLGCCACSCICCHSCVNSTRYLFSSPPPYLSVCLCLSWLPKKEIKGLCCRPFGASDSFYLKSAADCDPVKCPCSCRLCWVCTYELDHTWEGCPLYLCASHFPCNCGWNTGGAGCVGPSHLTQPSGTSPLLLIDSIESIKGDCKLHWCAVFNSTIKAAAWSHIHVYGW